MQETERFEARRAVVALSAPMTIRPCCLSATNVVASIDCNANKMATVVAAHNVPSRVLMPTLLCLRSLAETPVRLRKSPAHRSPDWSERRQKER